MTPVRVLATKNFFANDLAYLRAGLGPTVELIMPPTFTADCIAECASNIHVLLGDTLTKHILESAQDLRLIQVPWTGVDRLDFALLQQYDVPVCNSHSNARAVAEMAVGLMLAITKKIPLHDARLRQGHWMRPQRGVADSHFPPTLLSEKTVGFVGYGAVAQQTTQLLAGFNFTFIAAASRLREPPAPLAAMYGPADSGEIASRSDIVFVCAPLCSETRGLIDARFFARMRPGAYLINTSRGELVDEKSLYEALASRKIAGAAIDTWYQYPTADNPDVFPSARFPFHTLDNLVLSPHRSGFVDGDLPHLADVVSNLNRLANGEPLINRVDLTRGF
jgi:phosphoglycerate dehydrogenase-like enzyme